MMNPTNSIPTRPLCVDLDGTLLATDTMLESILVLLRHRPWMIVVLLFWLVSGRNLVAFKHKLMSVIRIDPATWPWRADVIDFVRKQHDAGRTTVLATASNIAVGRAAGEYLGIFDHIIATDQDQNLKGQAKVDAIRRELAIEQYDYIGDSSMDFVVWQQATEALLVSPSKTVERKARATSNVTHVFRREDDIANPSDAVLRSTRPIGIVAITLLGVAARLTNLYTSLSMVTSILIGMYLWQGLSIARDLLYIEQDRLHPVRCRRPIAAGHLPLLSAIKRSGLLILGSTVIAIVWILLA